MCGEREICMREYDIKVVLCECDIRYASKVCEKSPLCALEIRYPLLLQQHKVMSEKSSTKKKFELDQTFLLEASIQGSVLRFTDDKATRNDIRKRLGRIAVTASAVYRKTTSMAKEELHQNVKKFHVFENQLKSQQLAERKVKELESEIQGWKRKYQNIKKEKEDIFNEMTAIILGKDEFICQLQKNKQ